MFICVSIYYTLVEGGLKSPLSIFKNKSTSKIDLFVAASFVARLWSSPLELVVAIWHIQVLERERCLESLGKSFCVGGVGFQEWIDSLLDYIMLLVNVFQTEA